MKDFAGPVYFKAGNRPEKLIQVLSVIFIACFFTSAQTNGTNSSDSSQVTTHSNYQFSANFSSVRDASSLNFSSITKDNQNTETPGCRARVIVNISLAALTIAGLTEYIITDIRGHQIKNKFDKIQDTWTATSNEIDWERMRAKKNIFGALTLGSASVLAISFIIPVGKDNCTDCMENHHNKRSSKSLKKDKKS